MYIFHFDHPNQCWNVFLKQNGREEFVRSFKSLSAAMGFCDEQNAKLEGALR